MSKNQENPSNSPQTVEVFVPPIEGKIEEISVIKVEPSEIIEEKQGMHWTEIAPEPKNKTDINDQPFSGYETILATNWQVGRNEYYRSNSSDNQKLKLTPGFSPAPKEFLLKNLINTKFKMPGAEIDSTDEVNEFVWNGEIRQFENLRNENTRLKIEIKEQKNIIDEMYATIDNKNISGVEQFVELNGVINVQSDLME